MRNGVFCKSIGFTPLEMLDIVDGLAHDTWHEMKLASTNVILYDVKFEYCVIEASHILTKHPKNRWSVKTLILTSAPQDLGHQITNI